MIAGRVLHRRDVEARLRDLEFSPTGRRTATGEIWRNVAGRHVQVPDPDDAEQYPDWMIRDLIKVIGRILPKPPT